MKKKTHPFTKPTLKRPSYCKVLQKARGMSGGGGVRGFPCMPVIVTSGIPSSLQAPAQMVQRSVGEEGIKGKGAFELMWITFHGSVYSKKAGPNEKKKVKVGEAGGELTDWTWASSVRIVQVTSQKSTYWKGINYIFLTRLQK